MRQNARPVLTIDGRLLRPSRAAAPRAWRSRRRLLALLPRLAGYTLAFALLGALGWAASIAIRDAAIFQVRRAEFIGLSQLDPARLEQRIAPLLGLSLFVTDPQAVLNALEGEPYIAHLVVRRQLLNRLVVEVEERVPAALGLLAGRWKLLDRSGVVLGDYGTKPPEVALPLVTLLDPSHPAAYQAALRAALQAHHELARARIAVAAMEAAHPDRVGALLRDRPYRLLVGSGDAHAALQRFLSLSAEIDARSETFDTVDLRFEDQVVLRRLQPVEQVDE